MNLFSFVLKSISTTTYKEIKINNLIPKYTPNKNVYIYTYIHSNGGGNRNPLQYSFLENSMDKETWWVTVHELQRVGRD